MGRPPSAPKTELAGRLRAVREAVAGENRDAFADLAGISSSTIGNYERGDRVPDAEMLQKYRLATGVSADWLLSGDGQMFIKPVPRNAAEAASMVGEDERRRAWSLATGIPAAMIPSYMQEPRESVSGSKVFEAENEYNLVRLPVYDVSASAGLGVLVGPEVQLGALAFDPAFLRDRGAAPDQCSIITASGDSMQPSIPDGSLLVVDHSQTDVKNGHIMVINVGDDLLVKRIRRRLDGMIELISDNPAYPPETIGRDTIQQLRVVGRVVYFCRVP